MSQSRLDIDDAHVPRSLEESGHVLGLVRGRARVRVRIRVKDALYILSMLLAAVRCVPGWGRGQGPATYYALLANCYSLLTVGVPLLFPVGSRAAGMLGDGTW
eukprot:scaffold50631_cov23-Phaeocystis_antarctica.AAC.1